MKKTCSGGFTLIEMMITIAIAGVLLAIAAPSFQGIVINNRITAQANEFVSGLALARSEAVKRGTSVRVTAAGGDFSAGWTIAVIASGEILRVHEALNSGFTLASNGANTEIQYRPTGISNLSDSFTLCYIGYTGRLISVSVTGRVSTTKTASVCS